MRAWVASKAREAACAGPERSLAVYFWEFHSSLHKPCLNDKIQV